MALFTAIVETLKNATAIIFRWQKDKNAEDVKQAQKQQDEANARAGDIQAVQNQDADAVRKKLAE